ncbi:MAG: LUD domain-containing protein, partial [Promethearchaeota archaeon]
MSDRGAEAYEAVKNRIKVMQKEGTWENKFGRFWKLLGGIINRQHDLRYLYEDSGREFVDRYRDRFIAMKDEFIENMDYYIEKCIKVMREVNNMTVYLAKTNEEAQGFLLDEIGDAKVIYKSKSNEAKDIGIIDFLKNHGIEVKETDLGDVLVQLFDYKLPSFGVGPGVHFSREEIVEKIKEVYGIELEPTASAIVKYFRETYRRELLNDVKISLTSANVISAEDGIIVLGENEGNISLLTRATEKHIVLCGITKIVPTILDAILVAKLQTRINHTSFNYINLISGPSATGDIQGEKVLGMYGAKEVVVILVDDWRTKAVK